MAAMHSSTLKILLILGSDLHTLSEILVDTIHEIITIITRICKSGISSIRRRIGRHHARSKNFQIIWYCVSMPGYLIPQYPLR
jgi:hypothetical protein